MSFKDPETKLTEAELDREKERARLRMMTARNRAIWAADTKASRLFNATSAALLKCRTEHQVIRLEGAFTDAMTALQNMIEGQSDLDSPSKMGGL